MIDKMKLSTILESELREVISQKTQKTEFIIDNVDFAQYRINNFSGLRGCLRDIHGGIRGSSHPTEKTPLILNFKFNNCEFPGSLLFDSDLNIEFNDCTFFGFKVVHPATELASQQDIKKTGTLSGPAFF